MANIKENEKYYLDTKRRYEMFQQAVKYRLVVRSYYDGFPYTQDPEDSAAQTGKMRKDFLKKMRLAAATTSTVNLGPDRADGIDYIDNMPRRKIDNIVADILPDGSRLTLTATPGEDGKQPEITDKLKKELFKRLLYFGRTFDTDEPESDFFAWASSSLADTAQTGDGMILLTSTEEEDLSKGRMMYEYINYECWDAETDMHAQPKFYRVEFKFVEVTGKEMWYRRDYFKDYKIVYYDEPVDVSDGLNIPPSEKVSTAIDPSISFYPPKMRVRKSTNEGGVLEDLGDFCVVEVIWSPDNIGGFRGEPEFKIEDMPAVDINNELLNSYTEGTIYVGTPVLAIIDGESLTQSSDGSAKSVSRGDYKAGAKLSLKSTSEDHQAKMAYPDNQPDKFPHIDTMRTVKTIMMGVVPDLRPDVDGMKELSRLSGYAYQTILRPYYSKIERHRRWAVGKIIRALRLGLKMLKIQDRLPAGLPEGLDIGITYGQQALTEDELLKQATRIVAYWKLGIPIEALIQLLPVPPELINQIIESVNEQKDLEDAVLESSIETAAAEPEVPDDTDNKLK